jgi:2-dehydro-3-deoxyphosphogluconate aldolase / (4S)-4-hydroxy-2-oxoglutarate aldolase
MTTRPDRLAMSTVVADRPLAVVRAPEIPDPVALANALAQSGIGALELTFTTLAQHSSCNR